MPRRLPLRHVIRRWHDMIAACMRAEPFMPPPHLNFTPGHTCSFRHQLDSGKNSVTLQLLCEDNSLTCPQLLIVRYPVIQLSDIARRGENENVQALTRHQSGFEPGLYRLKARYYVAEMRCDAATEKTHGIIITGRVPVQRSVERDEIPYP